VGAGAVVGEMKFCIAVGLAELRCTRCVAERKDNIHGVFNNN